MKTQHETNVTDLVNEILDPSEPTITTTFFMIYDLNDGYLAPFLGNMSPQEWVGNAEYNKESLLAQATQLLTYLVECPYIVEDRSDLREVLERDGVTPGDDEEIDLDDYPVATFTAKQVVLDIYGASGLGWLEKTDLVLSGTDGVYIHPKGFTLFKNGYLYENEDDALQAFEESIDSDESNGLSYHLTRHNCILPHYKVEDISGRIEDETDHVYAIAPSHQEETPREVTYVGLNWVLLTEPATID